MIYADNDDVCGCMMVYAGDADNDAADSDDV